MTQRCKYLKMTRSKGSAHEFDVVIGANFYYPHISGLSDAARMLAERLAQEGLHVRVVCCRHDKNSPTRENLNGVEIERVPVIANVRNGPVSPLFPFRLAARARKSALLNLHLPMLESGIVSLLTKNCKQIITYQCDYVGPDSAIGRIIEKIIDASNRAAIDRASCVVVSSHDYAKQSRLAESLTKAIPITPPFKSRAEGSPSFRRSAGFHYGFLGRITIEKGLTYLIHAFKKCAGPDDRLLIGGDLSRQQGESTIQEVKTLVSSDARIELLGFIADDLLGDFYASLDAFVFPSVNRLEAFGIVQMEALSAGIPVIASNLPGVRTIILNSGGGLLAEPGDIDDLARVMTKIRSFNLSLQNSVDSDSSLNEYVNLFALLRQIDACADENNPK